MGVIGDEVGELSWDQVKGALWLRVRRVDFIDCDGKAQEHLQQGVIGSDGFSDDLRRCGQEGTERSCREH